MLRMLAEKLGVRSESGESLEEWISLDLSKDHTVELIFCTSLSKEKSSSDGSDACNPRCTAMQVSTG